MEYIADLSNVSLYLFDVVGALTIDNKCCKDKKVIVTKTRGANVFSCQCECGGWCTTGKSTIIGAIEEWEKLQ